MAPTAVMRMQHVPTLLGAILAHAYQAILEMERVAMVGSLTYLQRYTIQFLYDAILLLMCRY